MIMPQWIYVAALLLLTLNASATTKVNEARDIVTHAMDRWRGNSSIGEMRMTIHRPDWERSVTLKTWTSGLEQSLILVTSPAKDKGNATLLVEQQLWSYSPKINRIIKIPSSMMNQSWLGSDFSNRDITKSTEILNQYTFELLESQVGNGHTQHVIQATPLPDAPVVWGKEVLTIRDDFVMLQQQYFDQDMALVKTLQTLAITVFDGRPIASHMRVSAVETPDQWTDMEVLSTTFDATLPDDTFTLSNLRSVAR